MKRLIFIVAFVLAVWPVSAKRGFEVADYFRTAFVGAPVIAPDGSLLAFVVHRYELDADESWDELWAMTLPDGALRQLSFERQSVADPVFSADGKNLYFVATRGAESSQIWALPTTGGEARALTDFAPGLGTPVVSPDGRFLAVTASVYPECGADGACAAAIDEARAEGPLDVHVADELLYRHWTTWADGKVDHVLLVDAASGAILRDLSPGPWPAPTFSLGASTGYDFSPDGRQLVFVSNHEVDQASTTNADLWLVELDPPAEVEPRNLTADDRGWDGNPVFAADGESIYYLSQERPGYEADYWRLSRVDLVDSQIHRLFDQGMLDLPIHDLMELPDGSLLLEVEEAGRTPLYRFEPEQGRLERVVLDHSLDGWVVDPAGERVYYSRRGFAEPSEIATAPLDASTAPRRLSFFNADLEAEVDLRSAEEIVVSAGDYDIHVWLIKPHGFDPAKKYPLILNVHGGPQGVWADSYRGDWQVYPGEGYIVALPNPTGSTGYGQDLTDAIACDWGGRVFEDLMKVTDQLEQLPYVDPERMGAMGWSYGGYMMMWFAGHTERFKTVATMMGIYDLDSMWGATEELWFVDHDFCGQPWTNPEGIERWSPSASADKFRTPALVITGERDYRVPYTQSLQFFTALKKKGVAARLVVFPDAGHWPGWQEMAFYYNAHLDWFHRYLGGGEAPWPVEDHSRNRAFGEFAETETGERAEAKPEE